MATIKDVAKYAGVGIGTVSRVINNKGAVKPSTKAKVEEAIRALNFRPNEIARSFKMQNSKMIALLIPRINHPFFSELAFHVGGELYKRGYKLMICNAEFEADNELSYIEMLKQNKVEGMIILSYNDIDAYISSELPIVTIDRHYSAGITCITSDNYRGGYIAAEELVKAGCKKIAYLGTYNKIANETMLRKKGFIEAAEALKMEYVVYDQLEPVDDLHVFTSNFLTMNPTIDGVFANVNKVAYSLIKQAAKIGKSIPEDIQVIGFDGVQGFEFSSREISTIQQPLDLIASAAVEELLELTESREKQGRRIVLPVEFIKGDSTK